MLQYIDLDLQNLIDLLIVYIAEYEKMLSSKVFTEEEFAQCKQKLAELHAEIKDRSRGLGYSMDHILPAFPGDFTRHKKSNPDI